VFLVLFGWTAGLSLCGFGRLSSVLTSMVSGGGNVICRVCSYKVIEEILERVCAILFHFLCEVLDCFQWLSCCSFVIVMVIPTFLQ
jgi:hypothetical protein